MSSKLNLLKKKIDKIQAQLEVEMANNSKVSDHWCTAYTYRKEKAIVKRTAPKVIKRPKVIGKIKKIKAKKVIK